MKIDSKESFESKNSTFEIKDLELLEKEKSSISLLIKAKKRIGFFYKQWTRYATKCKNRFRKNT